MIFVYPAGIKRNRDLDASHLSFLRRCGIPTMEELWVIGNKLNIDHKTRMEAEANVNQDQDPYG